MALPSRSESAPSPTQLVRAQLAELHAQMRLHEQRHADAVARVAPELARSARNLLHYLALRQHDLRPLQRELTRLGLSSLGRSESHAWASVAAVRAALQRDEPAHPGSGAEAPPDSDTAASFDSGPRLLAANTQHLLGPPPARRDVRIMVTMPSSAAEDYALVRALVAAGMDVMRINSAHDGPEAWLAMTRHLQQARRDLRRAARVQLDLGGPKLRTGELLPAGRCVRWRVPRDVRGQRLAPARIWLGPAQSAFGDRASPEAQSADASLSLEEPLLARLRTGDVVEVRDSRQRARKLRVIAHANGGWWAECNKAAFVESGAPARLFRGGRPLLRAAVGELPTVAEPLRLEPGDALRVCGPEQRGRPARCGDDGEALVARIPCTLPEVFADLQVGERMLFDDGKIESVIRQVNPGELLVEVTRTPPGGAALRADKGINLPDSTTRLPSLTEADLLSLEFGIAHADVIAQSFVRSPDDVLALQRELAARGGAGHGVLLKIETRAAFDALPRILLAAMRRPPVGVMVARGDLAAEVGYDRLAEVQEEILWLCEAAHLPVVWATQVLESLARSGRPSRAEVTDAAMSGRAECVMLNKGPYVVDAVRFLDNVLHRMKLHHEKNRALLRRLSISSLGGRFRERTGEAELGDTS